MKSILVLGSLNIDLVQRVTRLPQAGETLPGDDLQTFPGGKGANQACAAAMLGGRVQIAGCVGNDVFAGRLLGALQIAGVDTRLVRRTETASGSAVIFVLPNGENSIVISPGANAQVSIELLAEAMDALTEGDFLLCQLEIPLKVVEAAIAAARKKQIVTILDPAPARPLPDELLAAVSIVTPNQTEAAMLAGCAVAPTNMSEAASCARQLHARGAATVIVKMGEQGCLLSTPERVTVSPGFTVNAIDTTAAGDTFNGALAVALASGQPLSHAATLANAAAALSVTKAGAISSIPSRIDVERFLAPTPTRR
jgi:ribokinase